MKLFIASMTLGLTLTSSIQNPAFAESIDDLLPPEYFELPEVDLDAYLNNPAESPVVTKAKCRGGKRMGDSLGRQFIEQVKPTCDQLLFPLGEGYDNEWSVPGFDFNQSTDAATVCTYAAFANAFEQTVLNTARNCGKMLDDSIKLAQQLEYNRCYVEAAQTAVKLKVSFGKGTQFITEGYVVVPQDSKEWDDYLASLVTIVGSDGQKQKSGLLQTACSLGASHATRKVPPINLFQDKPGSKA